MKSQIRSVVVAVVGAGVCAPGAVALAQQALAPTPPVVRGVIAEDVTDCTVQFGNQAGFIDSGSPVVLNVPVTAVPTRLRATCKQNGQVVVGASEPILPVSNGVGEVTTFTFGDNARVARVLAICAVNDQACSPTLSINGIGSTVQLTVGATFSDMTTRDVSQGAFGSNASSNMAVATVSADGLVTAVGDGTAVITANVEGKTAVALVTVIAGSIVELSVAPDSVVLEINEALGREPTVQLSVTAATDADASFDVTDGSSGTTYMAPTGVSVSSTGLASGSAAVRGAINVSNDGVMVPASVLVREFSPTPAISYGSQRFGTPASYDVAVSGDLAFVNRECNGIDIVEPLGAGLRGGIRDTTCYQRISADGNLVAAITTVGEGFQNGFALYDVSNPAMPNRRTLVPTTLPAEILLKGDRLYTLNATELRIYDVSNPANPMQVGSFQDNARAFNAMAVDRGTGIVVLSSRQNLLVVDTNQLPIAAVEIANALVGVPSFFEDARELDLALVGSTAYVAYTRFMPRQGIVAKFDLSNPAQPRELGRATFTDVFPRAIDTIETASGTVLVLAEAARTNSGIFLDSDLNLVYDLQFDQFVPGTANNNRNRGVVCSASAEGYDVAVGPRFTVFDVGSAGIQVARLTRGRSFVDIVTDGLPTVETGVPVDVQFQQVGAVAPTWRIVRGNVPGVTMSASGVFSGMVGASDSVDLSFVVEDGNGGQDFRTLTLGNTSGTFDSTCP